MQHRALTVTIGTLVAVVVAGCGGSSSDSASVSTSGAKSQATTTIKVGYTPIGDEAPLFVGIDKGYFAEQHLKIDPVPASGGAAIIPAVVSGDEAIGFSNTVSTLLAVSKGLSLKVVGMGVQTGADRAHDTSGVLVKKNSPIKTLKDLEGKTVSVNTLQNLGVLTVKQEVGS